MRLVHEHTGDYKTEWLAIKAIAGRLGMSPETLRRWVREAAIDAGEAPVSPATSAVRSAHCVASARNSRNPKSRNKFLRAGVRPATPLVCAFIYAHKVTYGVAPICRALAVHGVQIAPRTYFAHRVSAPSKRALWDTTITEILFGIYEPDAEGKRPPECLHDSLKMWAHLQRQGIPVARCTVSWMLRHSPRTREARSDSLPGIASMCARWGKACCHQSCFVADDARRRGTGKKAGLQQRDRPRRHVCPNGQRTTVGPSS